MIDKSLLVEMGRDDITIFIHIIPTSADDKKYYDEAPDQNNFAVGMNIKIDSPNQFTIILTMVGNTLKVRKHNNNGTQEKNLKD